MIDPEKRRLTIGGSEVGAIFNVDENRSAFDVWARKKGGLRDEPGEKNIRMIVGKALEQGVLSLYTYVTGHEVNYCDQTSIDPIRPWVAYTPDAICRDIPRGVDAKVVFFDQRHKWGETADDIPERVQFQCWWYCAAMKFDSWDVCALIGEGEPRIYTVPRLDDAAEKQMLERAREWHARYLIGDDIPPLGGSTDARRWLQRAFPVERAPLKDASDAEQKLMLRYAIIRAAEKALDKESKVVENEIISGVKDHEGIASPYGKFTWKRPKASRSINWEGVAESLLTAHVKDAEARATLLDQYTTTKENGRRIYFKYDNDELAEQASDFERRLNEHFGTNDTTTTATDTSRPALSGAC